MIQLNKDWIKEVIKFITIQQKHLTNFISFTKYIQTVLQESSQFSNQIQILQIHQSIHNSFSPQQKQQQKKPLYTTTMILFCIAIIVLVMAVLANFLELFRNSRVLVMSILAISMIVVNFINEVDIVVTPPQIIVKVESPGQYKGKKQVFKLNFKQQFQTSSMVHLQQQLQSIRQQLQLLAKTPSPTTVQPLLNPQYLKQSLLSLQTLPPKPHTKPLLKQEIYLLQQLKTKLIQQQDWIVHIPYIQKTRFQLLMQSYIKDINEKTKAYGLNYDKVLFSPFYHSESLSHMYKMGEKLSQKNYHYVVVFDQPTQKLLQFLHESYLNKNPPYRTVIFLQLGQEIGIFPISKWIQPLQFNLPLNGYLQPIRDYLYENQKENQNYNGKKVQGKDTRLEYNQVQRQLQTCQMYVDMDYGLLLRLMAFKNVKSIAEVCYQQTLKPISPQIDCLRRMISSSSEQIPQYKARRCWQNSSQPQNLLRRNHKIKLKKQQFWSGKLSPANFGLQIIPTHKTYQQL